MLRRVLVAFLLVAVADGTPKMSSDSRKALLMSQLSGSDNSEDFHFTRQQAWDWWTKSFSSKAPNCMRSQVNEQKQLVSTFCFFQPNHDGLSDISNYASFKGLNPEDAHRVRAADILLRGDPSQMFPIFGTADTFATDNLVWGNPIGQSYAVHQGWILYPLSTAANSGASVDWKTSQELLVECSTNPEKCRNTYRLLQISGGFEIVRPVLSRPVEETTTVKWAFVHSKNNSNTNYRVLDRGYFFVQNNKIIVDEEDANSKAVLLSPLVVSGFDQGQHVALWVTLESTMPRGALETGGQLMLRDSFDFRFIGACKLECDHGTANLDLCVCECPQFSKWKGKYCEVCGLDCHHGNGSADCSSCNCTAPWTGQYCDQCSRTCPHGQLIASTCECVCDDYWTGPNCDVCNNTCTHNGVINKDTCLCDCPVDAGWVGDSCEVCTRMCYNNGTLDNTTCSCNCSGPWGGVDCRDCRLQCYHGSVPTSACACSPCQLPWGGAQCGRCDRQCRNGGNLLKALALEEPCKCECPYPWAGDNCERCTISCNPLSSASVTPNADCSCTCVNYWQGRFCDYCPLVGRMVHGGQAKDDCTPSCPAPWGGQFCEKCVIPCQNGGLRLGETEAEPDRCRCQCLPGYKGTWCEMCEVATCGMYSVWAGEPALNRQCDCRSNGACTYIADANDRWCNTCQLSCITSTNYPNTHREAPWPVVRNLTKECYCGCGDGGIGGNRCEFDQRNKVVATNGRTVAAEHWPYLRTSSTCTSCATCWSDQQSCTWYLFSGWRCSTRRINNHHVCGFNEWACSNPVSNTGCCHYYDWTSSPRFNNNPSGPNCPTNPNTFPAFKALDGSCSVTAEANGAWLRVDLGGQFRINQISLNRGNDGTWNADLRLSNDPNNYNDFYCGTMTTNGIQTVQCGYTENIYRYVWVVGSGWGRIRVCSIDARFVA